MNSLSAAALLAAASATSTILMRTKEGFASARQQLRQLAAQYYAHLQPSSEIPTEHIVFGLAFLLAALETIDEIRQAIQQIQAKLNVRDNGELFHLELKVAVVGRQLSHMRRDITELVEVATSDRRCDYGDMVIQALRRDFEHVPTKMLHLLTTLTFLKDIVDKIVSPVDAVTLLRWDMHKEKAMQQVNEIINFVPTQSPGAHWLTMAADEAPLAIDTPTIFVKSSKDIRT